MKKGTHLRQKSGAFFFFSSSFFFQCFKDPVGPAASYQYYAEAIMSGNNSSVLENHFW